MTFKITVYSEFLGETLDMPLDKGMRLFDACDYAEIYKRKNPKAVFSVVNEENGDIEYQI